MPSDTPREAPREPDRATSRERSSAPSGRRPPKEEPDFVNEADIPTDDARPGSGGKAPSARQAGARPGPNPNPDVRTPPTADVAGVESAAGEEDPGAALDSPPDPGRPA